MNLQKDKRIFTKTKYIKPEMQRVVAYEVAKFAEFFIFFSGDQRPFRCILNSWIFQKSKER